MGTPRPDADPPGPAWRSRTPTAAAPRLPPSWGDSDAPLVYLTFGSVAGGLGHLGPIFRATLDAMAGLPIRVLLTTGAGLEPGDLGSVPPNVQVEAWWPQAEAMSFCSAVVGHGGFGHPNDRPRVRGAADRGTPVRRRPVRARRAGRGRRCRDAVAERAERAAGPGRAPAPPAAEPACEAGAGTVADEMASLPELASLLPDLADLVYVP